MSVDDITLEALVGAALGDTRRPTGTFVCEACGAPTDERVGRDLIRLCGPCRRQRQQMTGLACAARQ
ncbi:MAG TPA: hypothetical protein VFA11_04935 [Acidimicrobiales bacterium]|nr:hypothetical protein [Acidimicrobiales bacterium]